MPEQQKSRTTRARLAVSQYGRGERNCAVMSDAGAVVRFVRDRAAQTGEQSA